MTAMTWNDVVDLLSITAAYDQRTVGREDVQAWLNVAIAERWNVAAAHRAVLEHYRHGGDRSRISPAAISDRIRTLRGRAAESFTAPRIPEDLPNRDYPGWLRAQLAEHVDQVVDRWAAHGTPPPPGPVIETARVRSIEQLVEGAPAEHQAALVVRSRRMMTRRIPTDPIRRGQAADELARVRDAALAVTCPHCSAVPDSPCTRPSQGDPVALPDPHPARHDAGLAHLSTRRPA